MKLYCIEVTPGCRLNNADCGLPDHEDEPDGKRKSSLRLLMAAVLGLQLLCACGQPVPVHSGTSGPVITRETTVQSTTEKPARVIVRFRRDVPYRDATFLQDITLQIQARITYVSSVSGDTHVYLLESLPGSKQADALRRLANLSIILSVELDQLATHF